MPYTPSTPNAFDSELIPHTVRKEYFRETLFTSPLSVFMGMDDNSIIKVINQSSGDGETVTFSLRRPIDYINPILGFSQIVGNEQQVKFYSETVSVKQRSFPVILQGTRIVRQQTPIQIYEAYKSSLLEANQNSIVFELLKAATLGSYTDLANTGPTLDRVIYAGADYQANINAGINAMNTGIGPTQNGPSVALLEKARDMAINGGTGFRREKTITPWKMGSDQGWQRPMYVCLMSTAAYRILASDPRWKEYQIRPFIESSMQPSGLKASFWRGGLEDVGVYEIPELSRFNVTSGNTTAAWMLFCGAQALSLVWADKPWFEDETSDLGNIRRFAVKDIRGQKSIKFPSYVDETTSVENGIINIFAAINIAP